MATCIAGMHRSGTSLVTRLLHDSGLFLGPDEELAPPSSANPDGYWENVHFVKLNESLLAQFGGWWKDPPSFPAGWEFAPAVNFLFAEAEELVGRFCGHTHWGWKDPRNSTTIRFWRRLIPDLKVVICVRNPLEVAHSLSMRGDSGGASHFKLWLIYYRQLLSAIPPTDRLVTNYQSYFQDARAELRRVSEWIGIQPADETVDRACAHVSVGLRHHQVMTAELVAVEVPAEVLKLYLRLCAEAGPVYQQMREREKAAELEPAAAAAAAPATFRQPRVMQIERLRLLEEKLAKHQARTATLGAKLQALKSKLSFLGLPIRALAALRTGKARLWSRWRQWRLR